MAAELANMNITVNLDRGNDIDPFRVVRAILEGIEPGAGGHCLRRIEGQGCVEYEHHRLNVRIAVYPR